MNDLFAYRIPDRFFAPHKVVVPFYARVAYKVEGKKVVIEEISLSENCLQYVRQQADMVKDIRKELEKKIKGNEHVNPTMLAAILPHI